MAKPVFGQKIGGPRFGNPLDVGLPILKAQAEHAGHLSAARGAFGIQQEERLFVGRFCVPHALGRHDQIAQRVGGEI